MRWVKFGLCISLSLFYHIDYLLGARKFHTSSNQAILTPPNSYSFFRSQFQAHFLREALLAHLQGHQPSLSSSNGTVFDCFFLPIWCVSNFAQCYIPSTEWWYVVGVPTIIFLEGIK